jgi:hypothetical protein
MPARPLPSDLPAYERLFTDFAKRSAGLREAYDMFFIFRPFKEHLTEFDCIIWVHLTRASSVFSNEIGKEIVVVTGAA